MLAVFAGVERRSAHPMFDLKLLRLPTFSGGSVAAFGLSASIFSVLLYLVLYLQDILGYWPSGHSGNSWTACYRDCDSLLVWLLRSSRRK